MSSIVTIANAIIALATISKTVAGIIDKLSELWIDKQIADAKELQTTKLKKRKALMQAIQDAQTNEQRKQLSIILNDVNLGN